MKLKENRVFSFLMVSMVYVIAIVVGIIACYVLPFSLWLNVLIADVISTVVTFIFSLIFKNSSVYDPYWSVQPIVIIVALAVSVPINAARILPLIAICVWGIRLTANWAYTFHSFSYQDWRYVMLKEKTGAFYPLINFLGIHLFPTLVVYSCMLPVIYTFILDFSVNTGSVIFFILSLAATLLQGTADVQMHSYRKHRTTNFIKVGLWKYSRHPNYLGEILMWWGIALAFVCAVPSMWYLAYGALINTLMFLFVSVPMADNRQSKKQGFDEYKKSTRMLFPIKKF